MIFRALICRFDLSLKNVDKILNDDIFIESYMFRKQIVVMNSILNCFVWRADIVFAITSWDILRSSFDKCTVYTLFSNSLLRNSRKVSSFQFHWTRTIVYRVICDEMFVADFWFMLACLDFVKMFCNDIIFCNFWSCLHVRISWRDAVFVCTWRMHRNLISFVCFNSNEMFCQLICNSFSTCCITRKIYIILSKCFYKRSISFSFWFLSTCSNSKSCLHAKISWRNAVFCLQFTHVS